MLLAVVGLAVAGAVADDADEMAKKMVARMNLTEKVLMLHGSSVGYTGGTPAIDRLGIPSLHFNDGPQGFRSREPNATSTSFPGGLTIGATWDREMASLWGTAMGKEFFDKGANVQLGPGVCVARVPVNGRNFEYLSGEDPMLGYHLVQPVVNGIQSQGVIANVKHYAMNSQETNRHGDSAQVDERTRFEIYYPPFEGAVKANLGSIMCSYNLINGRWSCENDQTLRVELKERLNFTGWVMSDWGATHSTSINQGLDQEMPGEIYMGPSLLASVAAGNVTMAKIDESVARILAPMYRFKVFDNAAQWADPTLEYKDVRSAAHTEVARRIASNATVLLTNKNKALPLSRGAKVAVLGLNGAAPIVHGGGSGHVPSATTVSPLTGIQEAVGSQVVTPTPRCVMQHDVAYPQSVYSNKNSLVDPAPTSAAECCASCFAYGNSLISDECAGWSYGGARGCVLVFRNAPTKTVPSPGTTVGTCNGAEPITEGQVTFADEQSQEEATTLAKAADVAVVFVATTSSEGSDRPDLDLPADQLAMVDAVIKVQPNTVVVVVSPGAILLPFAKTAAATLMMFMPGVEMGHAVADVLFGDVSPSGRLPITVPNVNNEVKFTQAQYPGIDNATSYYSEKLLVGYRWYTQNGVKPHFAFGHGLSYTSFSYGNLKVAGSLSSGGDVTATITVTNAGSVAGAEVVQLYAQFPSDAGEPPLQLRDFVKTPILAPGASHTASFSLPARFFSVWDTDSHAWAVAKGTFTLSAGAASDDLRAHGTVTV